MSENILGTLVKKAKGDDRSLRKYAEESGVDPAIISKIINGSYIPKSTDIFRKLTSKEASPRGGVTYKQLVEAADTSKSYQNGIKAGLAVSSALLAFPLPGVGAGLLATYKYFDSVSNKISSSVSKDNNRIDEGTKEIKRFVEMAKGLILSALVIKGITFQIDNSFISNESDINLIIDNQGICEYLLRCLYIPTEYQKEDGFLKRISESYLGELILLTPSKEKKVTIVTNSEKIYENYLSYRNKLSYNGELSVILIDLDNVKLVKENYISHFNGDDGSNEFYII